MHFKNFSLLGPELSNKSDLALYILVTFELKKHELLAKCKITFKCEKFHLILVSNDSATACLNIHLIVIQTI